MNGEYTRGEVHAMIAPIMKIPLEKVSQVLIIVITSDDEMKMKGPSETPHILGQIVEQLFADAWNPSVGTDWEDNGSTL